MIHLEPTKVEGLTIGIVDYQWGTKYDICIDIVGAPAPDIAAHNTMIGVYMHYQRAPLVQPL